MPCRCVLDKMARYMQAGTEGFWRYWFARRREPRIETRQIETIASLNALLAPPWFGEAQVCRITRERIVRSKKTIKTIFAITSLTAEQAGRRLRALRRTPPGGGRGRSRVENRVTPDNFAKTLASAGAH